MSYAEDLNGAFEMLKFAQQERDNGCTEQAKQTFDIARQAFLDIFRSKRPTLDQRLTALKGYCKALDRLGHWVFSETEWELGRVQLEEEAAAVRRQPPAQKKSSPWKWLLGAGAVGTLVYLITRKD